MYSSINLFTYCFCLHMLICAHYSLRCPPHECIAYKNTDLVKLISSSRPTTVLQFTLINVTSIGPL